MLTAVQTAQISVLLEQFTSQSANLKDRMIQAAALAWLGFDDWYNQAAVMATAAGVAAQSEAAQQIAAGLSSAYVTGVYGVMTASRAPSIGRSQTGVIRNGAPSKLVHSRAANAYLRAIATGVADHRGAINLAVRRASDTMLSDLTLQEREAQQRILADLGVAHFRRILHPELSVSGSCGLCVAASQRTYNTGDLMPMHPPTCKCTVMPVIGDDDPGLDLNEQDIGQLRDDAGSNKASDLRRTRYTVHQHGELGPVLTKVDDKFRDQSKVALENDPERAGRMLAAALPMLRQYEAREESGEPHAAERLAYQQDLVARLEGIIERAA